MGRSVVLCTLEPCWFTTPEGNWIAGPGDELSTAFVTVSSIWTILRTPNSQLSNSTVQAISRSSTNQSKCTNNPQTPMQPAAIITHQPQTRINQLSLKRAPAAQDQLRFAAEQETHITGGLHVEREKAPWSTPAGINRGKGPNRGGGAYLQEEYRSRRLCEVDQLTREERSQRLRSVLPGSVLDEKGKSSVG